MGEQKLNKNRGKANKNRGKANKSHGNWIWRNEGQLTLIHILPLSPMSSSLTAHFQVFLDGRTKIK